MEKKSKIRICHQWVKILILGLALNSPYAFAEKSKKPHLPKSFESKSAPPEITDTDRMFIDLREAAKKNDVFRTQQLSSNLVNYQFDDYVAYFRIKPQLFDSAGGARNDYSADAQVAAFLNQYQGTALADRLRNDWLLVLGKRKDWARFDAEYAKFVLDDDTQVKCYSLLSKLSQGENPTKLAIDSRAILLDPSYFGQACQELVPSLVGAGGMTPSEAKAIGRAASERGFDTMAKRLGGDDPIDDIVKAAKADPAKAYRDFLQTASHYSKENQAVAWGVIGQFLAKKLDPNADDAYRFQQELGYNELLSVESQEWKVRAGLRAKDWALVKNAIDGMNPAVRSKDPAWTYWYGRALKAEWQEAKAKESFELIADQYNFYGQLAREELGKSNHAPSRTKVTEQEIDAMATRKGFIRGERLYAMNLRFEGNREWNWELRNMTDRQLLAAAEHAKRIHLYDRVVNTADRTKQEHDFSLRYPTPFRDELSPIARQSDLNLAWAYGLIRQESRFIMNASSSVGASGLMQVMPNTAKYVAKKIGMTNYTNDKLSDTNTNLTLGSNYLNMVLIDLNGSWVLASAAYNAGPSRSKAWREKLTGPTEGAIFTETIPLNETRTYVKNVLSNANYYSSVMNGQVQSLKQRLSVIAPKAATPSELP
ncbi:lytic transglycosylase domain-containing protein [Polynucleobacter necessarius]|uniref:lytic transglycosylase domain-containing protein n=1 Tax=Polynucleobacter necessarius TaxID=576610 RepID=UPI000E09CB4A|nr:lytic transglycosylase domain-containing protein [Polynucleobacter necessarius]